MKSDSVHKPKTKFERLLVLYYNIVIENNDGGCFYEKNDGFYLDDEFTVSRLTCERYINILKETDKVLFTDFLHENSFFLHTEVFHTIEEVNNYIEDRKKVWIKNGKLTSQSRSLLHLIRMMGWIDLFYAKGKISEKEIYQYYSDSAGKRMVQRDFKCLNDLSSIKYTIKRKYLSDDKGINQWYYVTEL